jgi:hypothetical protein
LPSHGATHHAAANDGEVEYLGLVGLGLHCAAFWLLAIDICEDGIVLNAAFRCK